MAPSRLAAARRTTLSQNEHVPQLGKAGRKTGLVLPEGRRDEHGFEEIDNMFSSPEKDIAANNRNDSSSDEEQDMELDDATVMGPATTRRLQQNQNRLSLPRARSPVKTNLQSPARQNPHVGPTSSPTRGSIVTSHDRSPKATVARKLDFSMNNSNSLSNKPTTNGHAKTNGVKPLNGKLTNGRFQTISSDDDDDDDEDVPARLPKRPQQQVVEEEEEEDDEGMQMLGATNHDDVDVIDNDIPEEPDYGEGEEEEEEEIQEVKSSNKAQAAGRRGRKPKAIVDDATETSVPAESAEENEVAKTKGRPKAAPKQAPKKPTVAADPSPPVKKRGRPARNSTGEAEEEHNEELREVKRQKTEAKPSATTKEKGKPGRKRKSDGNTDSPAIQRGPPLPKGRGLVTVRRDDTDEIKRTRSGRTSFKPLEWWRGEHVEYDEDNENLFNDHGERHFKMPTVKGVVRKTQASPESKRPGRRPGGGARSKARQTATIREEEEVEREEWEDSPGRIAGEVIFWYPEHEFTPPQEEDQVEVVTEDLAISENAIQLKDIKDATFRFAKTLTLPFFGSGIVDLPPGSEKRPKNSRKMHLAFFVYTGSVQVTIAQTTFGIGKGGMFFVPRGNHYSIVNETDQHARLFFSQGCEILAQPEMEEAEE
ncbi:hypothetical protein F5Y16DRAFT_78235 [Xylariaceae sp. FL0255]|nr:hypothetical protein F5Y16DRAFT_78235 [Xylariaceae sp. FL0255]